MMHSKTNYKSNNLFHMSKQADIRLLALFLFDQTCSPFFLVKLGSKQAICSPHTLEVILNHQRLQLLQVLLTSKPKRDLVFIPRSLHRESPKIFHTCQAQRTPGASQIWLPNPWISHKKISIPQLFRHLQQLLQITFTPLQLHRQGMHITFGIRGIINPSKQGITLKRSTLIRSTQKSNNLRTHFSARIDSLRYSQRWWQLPFSENTLN